MHRLAIEIATQVYSLDGDESAMHGGIGGDLYLRVFACGEDVGTLKEKKRRGQGLWRHT